MNQVQKIDNGIDSFTAQKTERLSHQMIERLE